MGAADGAGHPELGPHRRTYRPVRRKPSAYALLLLALLPLSALVLLLTLLLGVLLGRDGTAAAGVLGGLALVVPFTVRVLWWRRHTRVELRRHDRGLVAVAADGAEVVFPWASTTVFTDGSRRYKLCTADGTVVTLGAANRGPVLGGERIRGLRTRTAIRGLQLPHEEEWGPAIVEGVRDAQLAAVADAALNGGAASFGDLVLNQEGVTVRRRRGRDDFTTWQDVDSLALTTEGALLIASRGSDFPNHFARSRYRIPNLDIFLDVARQLHERGARPAPAPPAPAPSDPAPADPATTTTRDEDVPSLLGLYVTAGVGVWAAWRLGTGEEIDGLGPLLLTVVKVVLGGLVGAVFGLGLAAAFMALPKIVAELLLEPLIRWFRHRRYVAAATLALCAVVPPVALLVLLFRAFPSRLVPLTLLLFFGGWALLLVVKRCDRSGRLLVRHLPHVPGVLLVVLAAEQLVSGDVLTVAPAAGLFFPLAVWLSWRGWRRLQESTRPTVGAAADIVLSVELGLVLTVFLVWLANVLSFTPLQVTVVRETVEKVQELTEVPWPYWLAVYTVLAVGSYAVLRWPDRVARVGRRLRPARLGETRLPLGATANFFQRTLAGINVGIMVALLFLIVPVPVSEGAWKRPVAERHALEVERRQYAEGAAAAYQEIHRQVSLHPRSAAGVQAVVLAVHRVAPSRPGEPVNRTALDIARQVGRFQAGTLTHPAPAPPPDPAPAPQPDPDPAPQPDPPPEGDDLGDRLGRLGASQRLRAEREQQTERFAELASLAITRTFDALDLGDNEAVQLVREYLGGLVEDGPVKKVFHRWGQGIGRPPPDGGRLVRVDVRRLTAVAYARTHAAVQRADAGLLAFYGRFGIGVPSEDSSLAPVVDLANQHRYLRQGTGPCTGCVGPPNRVPGTGGGGGRR